VSDILQEILKSGAILVIDPTVIQTNPDDFLDHYGHMVDAISLVAKGRSGFTFYQSNSAPKDKTNGVFFHSFCTIADNMGIKVDAVTYVHGDSFLSQNTDFQLSSSDGATIASYSCPSQENLVKYSAAIASEIAQYPIESLVLDDLMLASKRTCFCDRCRRLFASKRNIERDFSFEYLESRDLMENWNDERSTYINQTLREITDAVKSIKNIDISFVLKADKETGFITGANEFFGQNITELAKITNNIIIHVNPWSESFPAKKSPEYQHLVSSFSILSEYSRSGIKPSLYFWNIDSKEKLDVTIQLKDDLKVDKIYLEPSLPHDFTKRRTINLGF